MEPTPCSVAVAVSPRLLGDSLSRSLRDRRTDVTALPVDLPPNAEPVERRFDVALVTGSLPPGVTAEVVLRLADPRGDTPAVPSGDHDEASVVAADLAGIVRAVHAVCGRCG